MQQNRDVMASLSSDARGAGKLLLGRYNDGSIDADMYLKAFSSDSGRQDRVGREGAVINEPMPLTCMGNSTRLVRPDIQQQDCCDKWIGVPLFATAN